MLTPNSDPRTKQEVLDRLLREDFDGDLRSLAKGGALKIKRVKPHVLKLRFDKSGKEFLLEVHKERSAQVRRKIKAALAKRKALRAKGDGGATPGATIQKQPRLRRYPTLSH